jgi:23S rRNA pseudouridine1911/1915/1917 synthase
MIVKIAEGQPRPRLDVYLTETVGNINRAFITKLGEQGRIKVNGQNVKSGFKLKTGDKIDVDFDFEQSTTIPEIDLPVLYEDDDCIVINKPTGVLTHSKGAFNPEATVASFVQPKIVDMDGDRSGIVHRLDRATSGVIIAAKTPDALTWLQKQFSQRKVKKTYYAVIEGTLDPAEAIVNIGIGRNPKDPKTFRVTNSGKPATTAYEVIEAGQKNSLIKLTPATGRTHQLRVHLRYLGHPIIGDTVYEGAPHERLMLHAEQLELTLPNRERKIFTAELPASFRAIL